MNQQPQTRYCYPSAQMAQLALHRRILRNTHLRGKTVMQNLKFTARKSEVRFTPGSIPQQALTGFGSHAC